MINQKNLKTKIGLGSIIFLSLHSAGAPPKVEPSGSLSSHEVNKLSQYLSGVASSVLEKKSNEACELSHPNNPPKDPVDRNFDRDLSPSLNSSGWISHEKSRKRALGTKPVEERLADLGFENRDQSPFEIPKFYQLLQEDLDYTQRLLQRWWQIPPNENEKLWGRFGKFYPLLVDPAIYVRRNLFEDFLQERSHDPNSSGKNRDDLFQIRESFSKKMGILEVYRGMILTPSEVEQIKSMGIITNALRNAKGDQEAHLVYKTFFSQKKSSDSLSAYDDSPLDGVRARLFEKMPIAPKNWTLISVTQYPEIALSIGACCSRVDSDSSRKLYLFKMAIPALSTLQYQKDGAFSAPVAEEKKLFRIQVGDSFVKEISDPGIEIFVPFVISPNQIVKDSIIEKEPMTPLVEKMTTDFSAKSGK